MRRQFRKLKGYDGSRDEIRVTDEELTRAILMSTSRATKKSEEKVRESAACEGLEDNEELAFPEEWGSQDFYESCDMFFIPM